MERGTDGDKNWPNRRPHTAASIWILIWADHISVSVAVAAVVVVVIAVGPYRSGSDRCRTIGRTSIGTAIGRATINPSGRRRARYRAPCDGAGHVGVSPGMYSPAPDVSSTHATPMEASATAETTASTTASERIVRDKIYCNKKDCRESSESIPKHGASSLLIWGNSIGAFRLARRFDAGLAKQYPR